MFVAMWAIIQSKCFARMTPLRISRHIKIPMTGKREIGGHNLKKARLITPFSLLFRFKGGTNKKGGRYEKLNLEDHGCARLVGFGHCLALAGAISHHAG